MNCAYCGGSFEPMRAGHKYCSPACGRKHWPKYHRCSECGTAFSSKNHGKCEACRVDKNAGYKAAAVAGKCECCGGGGKLYDVMLGKLCRLCKGCMP